MPRFWPLLILVLLAGCGDELPASRDGQPSVQPDGGTIEQADSSAWSQPVPPICPQQITGSGAVWLDDPADMRLVERPLHCLAGTGQLEGLFISSIRPESWQPAQDADHRFNYALEDHHLQEVQVYYAVVGMVGYFQPHFTLSELPPIQIDIRSTASFATSRYDLPDRLAIGLAGVIPEMLPIQVTCHEFAHHLIMRHAASIEQVLNEGLADYLAADFTGNPRILALDRMNLPAALKSDPEAMAIAARYLERSVDNDHVYPDDAVTQQQLCQTLREAAETFPDDTGLVPEAKLQRCDTMSNDELSRQEPHRTGMILAGALWELRHRLGSQPVNAMIFWALGEGAKGLDFLSFSHRLVQADSSLHDGAHTQIIEQVFGGRGLL